jgi:RNA-directed DNA polymerase
MSLATPSKIRDLQIKLYRKAKNEPGYRFYMLYDKIYREDILSHAYNLARANKGAPGVDGQNFEEIETRGLTEWLNGIRQELRDKTYQPQPVRRVMIPKPGGGERPLGIPTIRDRVVQTAAKLVIEPIFEADLEPSAYGYRPKRSAQDAIGKVHKLVCEGYTDVVDADLSKYFDTVPHCELMQCVAQRIVDRDVLRLIRMWLTAPVEERDENGKRRLTGGKDRHCGTPQGGVASPMLANLYMNRLLKGWKNTQRGEQFQAQIVDYADDFVILSRGKAAQALDWTRGVVTRLGLTLSEAKTSIRQARIKGKVGDLLVPSNVGPWAEVRDRLNRMLRGWSAYYSYGTRTTAYRAVDNHVYERVRHFLRRRHKAPSRGTSRFPAKAVFGELGVLRLRDVQLGSRS